MSEIEDLKEWINQHFSQYDKSRFDLYMKEKKAYSQGVKYIEDKFPDLPEHLIINLKHESGMAYVAKENRYLMDYAVHMYRQVESIFNEIFDINNLSDSEVLEKKKVLKDLYEFIEEKSEIEFHEFKAKREVVIKKKDGGKVIHRKISKFDKIGIAYDYNNLIKEIVLSDGFVLPNQGNLFNVTRKVKKRLPDYLSSFKGVVYGNSSHLQAMHQEKIFKKALYYKGSHLNGLSNEVKAILNKPQLNAFISMKHYRDMGQHNIASKKSLEKVLEGLSTKKSIEQEDAKYLRNPESIMDGNYYQRYIDMVIGIFSKFHNIEFDLYRFHGIDAVES